MPLINVTPADAETALNRLERGFARYCWIQENLWCSNVSSDEIFQKRFNVFYRVRRGKSWRQSYYALLEAAKPAGIAFPDALDALRCETGRIEASFASKLVATLDPSKPVVDSIVLGHFELRLPYRKLPDRHAKVVALYRQLCTNYAQLIDSPTGVLLTELFDLRYPGNILTPLKKIDLVLWQIRAARTSAHMLRRSR